MSFLVFSIYLIIGDVAKMSDRPSSAFLLSSKWLQKSIILGKCAIHDYLIYRREEELWVASWPSWSWCKKLKLSFQASTILTALSTAVPVSLNSFDAIRTVRPLEVVTARRKVISSSWSLCTVGSSSLSDSVSYSDSCSSSCSDSSWWSSSTCYIIIFSVDWAEVAYMFRDRVPALNFVNSWRTFRCLIALPLFATHSSVTPRCR